MMRRFFTLGALALALGGCQPTYDGLTIRVLNGSGDVFGSSIEVIEGQALVISIRPESSNVYEDYEDFNLVRLDALNHGVLYAAPADDVDRFVLVGASVGTTAIEVIIDGKHVDTLRAEVLPQEDPS